MHLCESKSKIVIEKYCIETTLYFTKKQIFTIFVALWKLKLKSKISLEI